MPLTLQLVEDRRRLQQVEALAVVLPQACFMTTSRVLILSGGVDTCAILAAARELGITFAAGITVSTGPDSPDLPFAIAAAEEAGLMHHVVHVTSADLVGTHLPACVKLLNTFDGMTLRNSLVVAAAMQKRIDADCSK